jgi:tryptophan-rich sensory protein
MKGLNRGPLFGRLSARLLAPYYLWVLYDLAWTFELWRLNGGA